MDMSKVVFEVHLRRRVLLDRLVVARGLFSAFKGSLDSVGEKGILEASETKLSRVTVVFEE